MNYLKLSLLILLAGCSNASEPVNEKPNCEFTFHSFEACLYHDIHVRIDVEPIAEDELRLLFLRVRRGNIEHNLRISSDTTLLDGDKGFISFEDINFDNIPDLAITTSFGVANLYLDYWVFDEETNTYVAVGNHNQFALDPDKKVLSNITKLNASNYEHNLFVWENNRLKKVPIK